MRKLGFVLVVILIVASLVGCGTSNETGSEVDNEANNEVYKISLGHAVTEDTSQQAGSLAFKQYVEEKSEGKITVDIYPNSQLGGDREMIEGVQEGSIEMITSGSAPQVNFVSSAVIFDLPFAFASNDEATKAFTDPDFLEAFAKEYDKSGFKLLGASNLDFRVTTTNEPINSIDDLKNITIRTMENKYHIALWESIGANPTPLAFNELYTALQQGTVDGQENPLELVYAQKFYEQQKYVTKTKHLPQNLVWIMNKEFYEGLPTELQTIVDEGSKAALDAAAEYTRSNAEKIEKELSDYGIVIKDLSSEELVPFVEATKGVWDMIEADCAPEVFEAYIAAMKK